MNTYKVTTTQSSIFKVLTFIILLLNANKSEASPFQYAHILAGVTPHHTMVSKVTKDPYGMIWLLSGGVIYRYDGVSVAPFGKSYGSQLPFYEVDNIYADPWGYLWISTRNGMRIFDLYAWEFIEEDHRLGVFLGIDLVTAFKDEGAFYIADRQGSIWSVGKEEIVQLFVFDSESVDERRPVGRMLVADRGVIWFAFGDILYQYDLQSRKLRGANPFPSGMFSRIEDMIPVEGGVLIRFYSAGYYMFDGSVFRLLHRPQFRTNDFTNWNHWSFEWEDKIIVFHEEKYMEFTRDTSFTLTYLGSHQLDETILHKRLNAWQRERNEWLLCTDKGLFSVFASRVPVNHINSGVARGMLKQGGQYFFGGYGYLKSLSSGAGNNSLHTVGPENNYYAFLELSRDTACIALEGDFLVYLINGKTRSAPLQLPEGTSERFTGMAYCLAQQSQDTLLVGTYNGIWKYSRSSGKVYPLLGRDGHFSTRGMRIQSISISDGDIAFTTNEGYFMIQQGVFRKIYPRGPDKLNIYAHTVKDGEVYLATKGMGIIKIDAQFRALQVNDPENGLSPDIVYQMIWLDDALFMGTHRGLAVLHQEQLNHYYHSDGLPFEEFNHQALYYDKESELLFMGGVGGYIYFNPATLLENMGQLPSRLLLSNIRIGKKSNLTIDRYARAELGNHIRLPADAVWLSMDFARPDYYRQAYQLQFRVLPFMDEFQDMPQSSQINMTGLSAGNYEVSVRIKALNSDQITATQTWLIHKEPVFSETLLFYFLLSLVIGAVFGLIMYERVQRTKTEYKLRSKISRDLHDDVGGLLTGISMQADLIRLRPEESRSAEIIGDQSRQATQMMDDIIWAIDTRNNDQDSLADRMKYVARQLLESKNIAISFDFDPGERKMSQSVRQNLFLIFKEAIHNICKHSVADTVQIGLKTVNRRIMMYVQDNGNYTGTGGSNWRKGNGLRNMEMRARQIGASLEYFQTSDGYQVKVIVPIRKGLFSKRTWRS